MNNKKQTAVEWLEYQLDQYGKTHFFSKRELIAKAKAMEKEQIINAHYEGQCDNMEGYPSKCASEYYKETYEK